MLEFYQYHGVVEFEPLDPNFDAADYFAEPVFNNGRYFGEYPYYPVYCLPKLYEGKRGRYYFDSFDDSQEHYRRFEILVADWDWVFIASAELHLGWWADIPATWEGSLEETIEQAEAFVDAWYWCQVTPGQLAIPELTLNYSREDALQGA